ncbi:hypothetical protein NC652_005146 [Populus alba x Populus x berolinensis]|nr:hypothetical protein NC652_005146 [Populus alba x Populus x berolinensis]
MIWSGVQVFLAFGILANQHIHLQFLGKGPAGPRPLEPYLVSVPMQD